MKSGRPLQFDPQQAVAQATALFWQQGFEATSTTDLMSAMNLSKSSLYQTFGSKQDLFNQCLEHYGNEAAAELRAALKAAPSAKQFLVDSFQRFTKPCTEIKKGCFLVNTTCEFGSNDAGINDLVKKRVETHRQILQTAIEQAQQQGDISADKDANTLSSYLMSSLCGLVVMIKMDSKHPNIKPIVEQVLNALE